MKKFINFNNIAIAVLIIYILLQWFNPGGIMPGGRTITIEGKKYEVIKHKIDTVEVEKTKIVTKKGKDIEHTIIDVDTFLVNQPVDTTFILKDYLAKVVYKDTLRLPDSLGTIALTDTITQNRILGRTWNAKVKERIIKEEIIVKEPAKAQVYYGLNAGVTQSNYVFSVASVGAGVILKTKKDKIYQFGVGVANITNNGINSSFSPLLSFGTYWKIKLKK